MTFLVIYGTSHWLNISNRFLKNIKVKGRQCPDYWNCFKYNPLLLLFSFIVQEGSAIFLYGLLFFHLVFGWVIGLTSIDFRSSHWQMLFKIGVLNNFAIFTEKHLCWNLFSKVTGLQVCNFIKKRLQHRCFSVNIAKCLRTDFFIEHFWWLLLRLFSSLRGRNPIF